MRRPRSTGPAELKPAAANGLVLAFSDDYVLRLKGAMDRLSDESSDLDRLLRWNNMTLRTAQSVIGIASSPNPIVA
ncbi:MAG: hypothetical protein GY715_06160 [Planctomycetes bacterium]|nr:hypothetical protein [Planctomycetota bacterium]